jgi:hypothetical protein
MPRLMLILVLLLFTLPNLYPEGEGNPLPASAAGEELAETAVEGEEASAESEPAPVGCFWKSVLPDPEFQPEAGDAYRIAVSGSDRASLVFSYARLRPHEGEPRLAVHTQNTPDNRVLVDQANPGLFTAETGEFTLSLFVPAGWPLYLVQDSDNPYADPVVLSNIVELP